MLIRKAKGADTNFIYNLIINTFEKTISKDYSLEGQETFKKFVTEKNIKDIIESEEISLVAEKDGVIFGYIATRGRRHISLLFTDSNHLGKGIGKKLLKETLKIIKEERWTERITVNSSPVAVKFYENMGFKLYGKREEKDGIISYPMSYIIK